MTRALEQRPFAEVAQDTLDIAIGQTAVEAAGQDIEETSLAEVAQETIESPQASHLGQPLVEAEYDKVETRPEPVVRRPEEILAAALARYGGATQHEANVRDWRERNAARVRDHIEPYSVVLGLTGGYPHGFRV